eukprot:5180625-Pyramimonas_sp.AAC.1
MVSELQREDDASVPVSMDRAMGAPSDFLKLMKDNSEHSQAMIMETITMCKVSESYKARNSKNRGPNEDEEFWEEELGNIQIGINEPPNFRAAPPHNMRECAWAKPGQVAGRDRRIAMVALVVFV